MITEIHYTARIPAELDSYGPDTAAFMAHYLSLIGNALAERYPSATLHLTTELDPNARHPYTWPMSDHSDDSDNPDEYLNAEEDEAIYAIDRMAYDILPVAFETFRRGKE